MLARRSPQVIGLIVPGLEPPVVPAVLSSNQQACQDEYRLNIAEQPPEFSCLQGGLLPFMHLGCVHVDSWRFEVVYSCMTLTVHTPYPHSIDPPLLI